MYLLKVSPDNKARKIETIIRQREGGRAQLTELIFQVADCVCPLSVSFYKYGHGNLTHRGNV